MCMFGIKRIHCTLLHFAIWPWAIFSGSSHATEVRFYCLFTGVLCIAVGLVIAVVDVIYPHRFSTILEVDYDTPYDRHIIIEESHDTRNNKKKTSANRLEEPTGAGLGSRLLR